jgi:hypothetical protein
MNSYDPHIMHLQPPLELSCCHLIAELHEQVLISCFFTSINRLTINNEFTYSYFFIRTWNKPSFHAYFYYLLSPASVSVVIYLLVEDQ